MISIFHKTSHKFFLTDKWTDEFTKSVIYGSEVIFPQHLFNSLSNFISKDDSYFVTDMLRKKAQMLTLVSTNLAPTDRQTDRQTDGGTNPLIEMLGRI